MRGKLVGVLVLFSMLPLVASAGKPAEKKPPKLLSNAPATMLANTCAGCHGSHGASAGPAIPIIGGLPTDYFIMRMQAFKEGKAPATLMGRIAKGYTRREIKEMAEYFSHKAFVPAKNQPSDAALASKGKALHHQYCEKCHSGGGVFAENKAGILAGQWKPYLQMALQDFISGERKAPRKMQRRLRKLLKKEGTDGVKALLEFYAR